MSDPVAAREALIVEAIGEAAEVVDSIIELTATLQNIANAIAQAEVGMLSSLAGFEKRMAAITDNVKTHAATFIATKAHEASLKSIDQQSRAMAQAARVAYGDELGVTIQRLQVVLQQLQKRPPRRWEQWALPDAAAVVASAATWATSVVLWTR